MDLPNSAEHYKVLDCDDYQFNYLSNVLLTSFALNLISIKHIHRFSEQKYLINLAHISIYIITEKIS
jgi:hypothetical protein